MSNKQKAICAEEAERKAYLKSLRAHGRIQTGKGALRPGVTHVQKKRLGAASDEEPQIVRKRFSAF